MFSDFPREMLTSRKIVNDINEFINVININNGIKHVYTSLYKFSQFNFKKFDYNSAKVDKIFFDFDGLEKFEEVKIFHKNLIKDNIKHCILISGGGFHVYIMVKGDVHPQEKKQTLTNAHLYFSEKYNVTFDPHIIGDLARLVRVPNTMNLKNGRFCTFLSHEDLEKGIEHILVYASSQRKSKPIFMGQKRIRFETFRTVNTTKEQYFVKIREHEVDYDNIEINLDKHIYFPPCIENIIKRKKAGIKSMSDFRDRFVLISFLRDNHYTLVECIKFLKSILPTREFNHAVFEERQVHYLYNRNDLIMPGCQTLVNEGLCHPIGCKIKGQMGLVEMKAYV